MVAQVSVSLAEDTGSVASNLMVQSVHCHANILFSTFGTCYEVYKL